MQINIDCEQVNLAQDLKTYIQRKLELALTRVAPYITEITISLHNVSDIDGNINRHCKFTLSVLNQPDIIIEDTQSDLYYVIDRSIHKAARTMERIYP